MRSTQFSIISPEIYLSMLSKLRMVVEMMCAGTDATVSSADR